MGNRHFHTFPSPLPLCREEEAKAGPFFPLCTPQREKPNERGAMCWLCILALFSLSASSSGGLWLSTTRAGEGQDSKGGSLQNTCRSVVDQNFIWQERRETLAASFLCLVQVQAVTPNTETVQKGEVGSKGILAQMTQENSASAELEQLPLEFVKRHMKKELERAGCPKSFYPHPPMSSVVLQTEASGHGDKRGHTQSPREVQEPFANSTWRESETRTTLASEAASSARERVTTAPPSPLQNSSSTQADPPALGEDVSAVYAKYLVPPLIVLVLLLSLLFMYRRKRGREDRSSTASINGSSDSEDDSPAMEQEGQHQGTPRWIPRPDACP